MNRTIGMIITAVTVICCACPGLFLCIFGGMIAAGQPVSTTVNGASSLQVYPASYGIAGLCLALILIAIPFAMGLYTWRIKPAAASAVASDFNGPIPPTS
jgi:hypothetical protein